MNRVGDGIDHFPSQRGSGDRGITVPVAHLATRPDRRIERPERQSLELSAHLLGQGECEVRLGLDAHVALATVVVHFVGIEGTQKAGEVVEAMAIVTADTSVEGERDAAGVAFGGQRVEQTFTLAENGNRRAHDAAGVIGRIFGCG